MCATAPFTAPLSPQLSHQRRVLVSVWEVRGQRGQESHGRAVERHLNTHTYMLRKGIKLFQSEVLLPLLQDVVIEPQLKLLFNVTWIRE